MFYLPLWIRQKASIRDHLNVILVAFFSKTFRCLNLHKRKVYYKCFTVDFSLLWPPALQSSLGNC